MNKQTHRDLKLPLLHDPSMKADDTCTDHVDLRIKTSSFFSLTESKGAIDVKRTFISDLPYLITIFTRLGLFGWSAGSILLGAFTDNDEYFYLAYLTNCTAVISLAYQMLAVIVSIFPGFVTQPQKLKESPAGIIKAMWLLYSIAAPAETAITFLFWTFDYSLAEDGPVNYCMVFEHGILASLVLLDGNLIGRIPLRWVHCPCVMAYMATYFLWNIIFTRFFVGDSPIYDILDWKNNFIFSAFLVFLIIAIVTPISFMFCLLISKIKRRYISTDESEIQPI